MKTDLATSIIAAIIGTVAAYFICNLVLPQAEDISFKTLDSTSANYTLAQPDPEIFNYRAINPTVEVYVGQCTKYNDYGECIDNIEYTDDNNGNSNTDDNGGSSNSGNASGDDNTNNNENGDNQGDKTDTDGGAPNDASN